MTYCTVRLGPGFRSDVWRYLMPLWSRNRWVVDVSSYRWLDIDETGSLRPHRVSTHRPHPTFRTTTESKSNNSKNLTNPGVFYRFFCFTTKPLPYPPTPIVLYNSLLSYILYPPNIFHHENWICSQSHYRWKQDYMAFNFVNDRLFVSAGRGTNTQLPVISLSV